MIRQIAAAVASEYRLIFQNRGVMLVLLFAPLIYTILYSSAYAKQIATEVPIAIIDHSQSHSSRELISMFGASPYIDIRYQPTDMQEAKSLFMNGDIYGIVYIPNNYDRCAARNEQRWISLYLDASYFLMYRQVFAGVAGTVSSIAHFTPFSFSAPRTNVTDITAPFREIPGTAESAAAKPIKKPSKPDIDLASLLPRCK